MMYPNGMRVVKGVHSLAQWVERKQEIMVGIVVEVVKM
jgi:hypothetical protein